MATKDEENIYLDVTGEPKEKYRKLVNKIKLMDGGDFIQSILKFTFETQDTHHYNLPSSDLQCDRLVNIYDIHRELCTSKSKTTFKKRLNCICSVKLKYIFIWKHENFEKKIVIGCDCFENLYKFIVNVYGHLPQLMSHIKVLKEQFGEAKRKIDYIKCDQCEQRTIGRDEDDGTGICKMCRAKNLKEEQHIYNKEKQEKVKVMLESLAAEKERKKIDYIARKRKENRRCYKCKDYNISKDNEEDVCCDMCVTIEGKYKYINCIGCDGRLHLRNKEVFHNGMSTRGCELYCDRWGCREGTRGRSNLDFFQDEDCR